MSEGGCCDLERRTVLKAAEFHSVVCYEVFSRRMLFAVHIIS